MLSLMVALIWTGTVRSQTSAPAVDAMAIVRAAEQARIDAMVLAAPSVVAVIEAGGAGGGSGVVITADGYGLTNFHVVAPMLQTRKGLGGMANGKVYPLRVLGIDPTGDLAMFKLEATPVSDVSAPDPGDPDADARAVAGSPETEPGESPPSKKAGRTEFKSGNNPPATQSAPQPEASGPFAAAFMGDSDQVRVGDFIFAMGNPFLLAEDYTPTTTFGLVSGVHRYQFGADGRNLVYTDCLQIDASINPGNSGGPSFNLRSELIGINGRASFEQRGRINVGLAYAIAINQAKRFIPALRAGLLVEHGLLGATTVDLGYRRVVFEKMLDPSPAAAAGIQVGDRLLEFGGRSIHSANQFLNMLGTYPAGWPVQVVYEHAGKSITRIVRLERLPVGVPFEAEPALNQGETRRILAACRAALGEWPGGVGLKWTARRETIGAKTSFDALEVEGVESADGTGRLKFQDPSGRVVREYQYTGRTAQVREAGKEWAAAGAEEAVLANLWSVGRRALIGAVGDEALKSWRVVGGDDFHGTVVDLLECKSEAGPLRIAIDPRTHYPVRMFRQSSDPPSDKNPTIEIEFENYQTQGGVKLPTQSFTYVGGVLVSTDTFGSYTLERP